MLTSLSRFVYNLSEIYFKKRGDKNCKSEYDFTEVNKLHYKCNKC